MCGIAGIIDPSRVADTLVNDVQNMLAQIGHRGPDGAGCVVDNGFALGSVRLAILDPAAGQQPFSDPSNRYWLSYNGEIYNYLELKSELEAMGCRFQTNCDTEVVLNAWITWGPDCLRRFNGCFSFAVYDCKTESLFLARDRFGKRPLFYVRQGNAFYFASEMKAFLAIPSISFEQDASQLASILCVWTPLPDQTGFKEIKSLPMGQWLTLKNGDLTTESYAELRFDEEPQPNDEHAAQELIRERMNRSVELRLRSDVEVGVYLSGGIDSSIVALLAKDFSAKPLSTFSVEFDDAEFDESSDQQLISEYLGTRHCAERISYQDICDQTPAAVYHAEFPAFRSAFVPMYILSDRTRREGVKVVLSGEGADEAFLGYDLFKETLLRTSWDQLSGEVRRSRIQKLYPHLAHYGPEDTAAMTGLYQQFSKERMPGLFSHELRFQNGQFSTRLLKEKNTPLAAITDLISSTPDYDALSPVEKAQWLEYKTLLPGYLLSTQGERMSLAHGVENRCPFLDPGVFSLATAINLKFDDGLREKRLLREAFRNRLPDRIIEKRKFPYRAPDAAAFAKHQPDYLDLVLSDAELAKLPFLNAAFAKRLANKVLTKPASDISTKENQTFLYLLSISLLHRSFVRRETLPLATLPPLEKVINLQRETAA